MAINCKKCENWKTDLTLSTFVQHVEDFRFWVNVAWRTHCLPEKEMDFFVTGLKPDVFRTKSIPEVVRHNKKPWTSQDLNYQRIGTFWISLIVPKRLM